MGWAGELLTARFGPRILLDVVLKGGGGVMAKVAQLAEVKHLAEPDEVRRFDHGEVSELRTSRGTIGHFRLDPGWHWAEHVKPIAGGASCQVPHFQTILAGRLRIRMDEGQEVELGPGDVVLIPPGHDAWVVGDEAVEAIDWADTVQTYAKR